MGKGWRPPYPGIFCASAPLCIIPGLFRLKMPGNAVK
nr:MAG TPA: hypothetical protein [Caudoviricetes sp.]